MTTYQKIFIKILLVLFPFFLYACSQNMSALPIHNSANDLLNNELKVNASILNLPDFNQIQYSCETPLITDDDVNEYICDLLSSHEEMIEITDRTIVKDGDVAVVDYIVYYKDKIVASTTDESLLVGSEKYGFDFENAIIGKEIKKPFSVFLNSPVDTDQFSKGTQLKYNITITSINYFKTYTSADPYILDYYGVKTETEFIAYCQENLLQRKQQEAELVAEKEFFSKIIEKSVFLLNQTEIAEYSKQIVNNYENLAYVHNLPLETYITDVMGLTEENFYEYCYEKGEHEIKECLVVGALAEKLNIVCSVEDYSIFYETEDSLNEPKTIENTDTYSTYLIIKDKVINYFQTT